MHYSCCYGYCVLIEDLLFSFSIENMNARKKGREKGTEPHIHDIHTPPILCQKAMVLVCTFLSPFLSGVHILYGEKKQQVFYECTVTITTWVVRPLLPYSGVIKHISLSSTQSLLSTRLRTATKFSLLRYTWPEPRGDVEIVEGMLSYL